MEFCGIEIFHSGIFWPGKFGIVFLKNLYHLQSVISTHVHNFTPSYDNFHHILTGLGCFFLTFSFSFLHLHFQPYLFFIRFNDYFLCWKEIVCVWLNCLAYAGILFK